MSISIGSALHTASTATSIIEMSCLMTTLDAILKELGELPRIARDYIVFAHPDTVPAIEEALRGKFPEFNIQVKPNVYLERTETLVFQVYP
jgi:hypothetical protein